MDTPPPPQRKPTPQCLRASAACTVPIARVMGDLWLLQQKKSAGCGGTSYSMASGLAERRAYLTKPKVFQDVGIVKVLLFTSVIIV